MATIGGNHFPGADFGDAVPIHVGYGLPAGFLESLLGVVGSAVHPSLEDALHKLVEMTAVWQGWQP